VPNLLDEDLRHPPSGFGLEALRHADYERNVTAAFLHELGEISRAAGVRSHDGDLHSPASPFQFVGTEDFE
jgi:hypothetical protein